MAKLLVLGAGGRLGRAAVATLGESGHEVVATGRRPGAGLQPLDVSDAAALRDAVISAEIVVSCVHDPQFRAESAAISTGTALVNVSSWSLADRRRARQTLPAGPGVVVAHAGLNPGLMTVLARELLRRHRDAVRLDLAATVPPLSSMGPQAFGTTWPFLMSRPRRPVTRMDYPAPVGTRRAFRLGQGEEGWLGELARHDLACSVWITLNERWAMAGLQLVNALGLRRAIRPGALTLLPRMRGGHVDEPKRDLVTVTTADGSVHRAYIRSRGDYRTAAAAIDAFVTSMPMKTALPGVVGAEEAFTLDDLTPTLQHHSIAVVFD